MAETRIRIGELARRTGVAPATLRAWQRRYGVPAPARTESGYRLYGDRDVELVQRLQRLLHDGMSISQAAEAVVGAGSEGAYESGDRLGEERALLERALLRLDGVAAHDRIDSLLLRLRVSSAVGEVMIPVLSSIGDAVARGDARIAQEHFATSLLRTRIGALTRGWEVGAGRPAVLAAVDGDHHDVGLMVFGLALRERGWRIIWLGASTPSDEIEWAAEQVDAGAVVLSMTRAARIDARVAEWSRISAERTLAIGGAGTSPELAERCGATWLGEDAVAAARNACFDRP